MTPPSLVIFDCDGVLVDTEETANRRLAEILTEHGLPTTSAETRQRFVGRSMAAVAEIVLAEDGIDIGPDFVGRWYRELPAIFADGVEAIPHVREALLFLSAIETPYCVASSAQVEKMHITLGSCGLLPLVAETLFSASMVENGKPAPDLFLHAAAMMEHEPERCAVIEDSPAGALAGQAAGMRVLGYAGDPATDAEGLASAGATVFEDMRELPVLLGFN
ncbi:HAD family hydrolase [Oricola sp.]|uniref:HAD family hydrolase n=1 Tax=Oricola sp. TaxID=1979950 RepID=UPI003BAB9AB9